MNQQLGLDSTHLRGRENQVYDKISRLRKDNLKSTNSILKAYPFMYSYSRYYMLLELSLRIFNFLATSSKDLPGPLRLSINFIHA